MRDENAIIIEAWNTVLFQKFNRFRHLVCTGLSGHSDAALRGHPCAPGERVLDIGCGFGDTTQQIARAVGPSGKAVGIDCGAPFIEVAAREARDARLEQTSFLIGDAQFDPLGGPYDRAFSRFGTMFFNLPGAALRNIRRSLTSGAEVTFVAWRRREDNPWLFAAEQTVREIVPAVAHEQTNQVHCGPGPFAWAGPDLVSDLLIASGYERVCFERCDLEVCIGVDIAEAIDFAMALGPAGEILRLAGADAASLERPVHEALAKTLSQFQRPDGSGLWAPSSTWLVSARNP